MNNVRDFIQLNMNFLNDIQSYHWQTESYSEHENTGEYYEKFSKLNDELVETWQGKSGNRIKFSAELRPGIMNYADNGQVRGEVQKQVERITKNYTKQQSTRSNGFRKHTRRYAYGD